MIQDISERKQMEEKLRRAHDELEVRVRNRTSELTKTNKILQDEITERKRIEEALRESEEKYRVLFEAAPMGIGIADLRGNILDCNQSMQEMTGFTLEELKSMGVGATYVDPDERKFLLKTLQEIGRVRDWEVRLKRKNGTIYYALLNADLLELSGHKVLLTTARDITESKRIEEELRRAHIELELRVQKRTAELAKANEMLQAEITERKSAEEALKQSEEKYRTLIDNIQDGVFIIQDEKIQFANEAFAKVWGYTVEEVIGKDYRELVAPEDLEMTSERYQRRQAGEDVPHEYEFRVLHKDGRTRILVNMNVGLINYRGRVASMGTVKDITEKKRLESQLLRAQRMESIGTLASGIAHDINNVLTPIMLSQELLQEKLTDEESKRLLNTIKRSTQRGANLMKQVQSFAKGAEGERNVLQVTGIISEIEKIAKETFPRSIEIRTDIPKDLWTISGDSTQLHQVIMNLCVNARDAMSNGGILRISAENLFIDENYARMNTEAKIGSYIVITVSDTGTGIPPEVMDRIFEPFFTTKEYGKGTGLGLSTSLGIVKSHGGFITVYSEVGKGTAFKVYLPVTTTNEIQKAQEQQHKMQQHKMPAHREMILVVDDEAQICAVTRDILETYGYRVIIANDGKEAITLYSQHRELIKAVLMDMVMPVMDGSASISEIRKINPEVKIIAVSGLTEKDRLANVADYTKAFLPKPYTTEKLLKTIQEVLSER